MPAPTLGNNLVDDLLPVVDAVRSDLLPLSGLRQYRVFVVKRTWTGARRGQGTYTDVKTELLPVPKLDIEDRQFNLMPTGRHEDARIVLTEVSLAAYSEDDLTGGNSIAANVQYFVLVQDGQGQHVHDRAYHIDGPPEPDREVGLGWRIFLKRAEGVV